MRRSAKIHPEKHYPIVAWGEVDTCPICLDDITDLECELTCSHKFHLHCIGKWLDDNTTCPVCRHDFSAPVPIASTTSCRFFDRFVFRVFRFFLYYR